MKASIQEYTTTEKGLRVVNLFSILGVVVMLILLPVLSLLGGANMALFIVTIIFSILNLAYYVVPADLNLKIMKNRLLLIYLPTLILLGIAIWDFIAMILSVDIFNIVPFLLQIACLIQGVSFSLLVAKRAQSNPGLLK